MQIKKIFVPTSTDCNEKTYNSENKVKRQIERVLDTMLDSLSSSERLFIDMANNSSAVADFSNIDGYGQLYEKILTTRISFPGKNENEAWKFGKLYKDNAIDYL